MTGFGLDTASRIYLERKPYCAKKNKQADGPSKRGKRRGGGLKNEKLEVLHKKLGQGGGRGF